MINPADIDVLDLLNRWRGPAGLPEVQLASGPSGLPSPLRDWYALASPWSEVWSAGTRIYEPSQIKMGTDRVVFMEDLTGDWVWAFDPKRPGVVYEGEAGGSLDRAAEDLGQLLVHATVRSVILLSNYGRLGSQVSGEVLSQILSPMENVGFEGWQWPRSGYRIFASDNLLAEVGPAIDPQAPWLSRDGYFSVRIAGLGESDIAYLDSFYSTAWIDTSFGG